MAWFSGKVSLGNFPDLAGAVNKFSESVKNIEKNFDSALGLDDKAASGGGGTTSTSEASGAWPADLMAFMGQKGEDVTVDSTEKLESSSPQASSLSKETEIWSTFGQPRLEWLGFSYNPKTPLSLFSFNSSGRKII